MKKVLLLTLLLSVISLASNATIHVVQVSNFQFSPANITDVFVGDTIRWQWVAGSFDHTTTCDPTTQGTGNSLPAGAATWNSPMTANSPTFDYKVAVSGVYNYWCIPHKSVMKASFTASTPLPVTLSSFILNTSEGKVSLNWKTQNEENSSYFSVRRSVNGSVFSEIARVPASGNSVSERSYYFTDTKISSLQKFYYYNIAVVDKDGRRMYTDTKMFKNNTSITKLILSLSPNPVSRPGHLMMTFNADKEGKMDVRLVNAEGKTILTTTMQAYAGVNNGHMQLGELPTGTYTLVCIMDGIKESHQIIFK